MPAIAPAEAALRQSSSGISVSPFAYQVLARDAERVRERGGGGDVGRAEHPQRQPADRARYTPAVVQQVVEGAVGGAPHVGLAAVDELAERGQRDVEPARRV